MARLTKKGIDYFSHDVDMMQDRRIKLVKAKHGLIGYAIYLRLLEELYRDEGYFLRIDDDFNLLFADENGINVDILSENINTLLSVGLFDNSVFKAHKILTSKRIQLNYLSATERRKNIEFIEEYLVGCIKDDVNIKRDNVNIYTLKEVNGTQSKGKKKKEVIIVPFEEFYKYYPKKLGKAAAEKAWNKLKVEDDLFKTIISSLEKQKQSDNWKKDNGQFIPFPATWLNGKRWEDEDCVIEKNVDENGWIG